MMKHGHAPLAIHSAVPGVPLPLPYADGGVRAGFPSPAQDYIAETIDLNDLLIDHPASTFFARVRGDSMLDADIHDGDLVIVDKSLTAQHGDLAICCLDGDFTLKRIRVGDDGIWLMPANSRYRPIRVSENDDFVVWGIVTHTIRKHRRG